MKKIVLLTVIIMSFANFSMNPVTESYKNVKDKSSVKEIDKKDIQMLRSDDVKRDYRLLFEEGYDIKGYSTFESDYISESSIKAHAKKIGSELVIYSKNFEGQNIDLEWDPFIGRRYCRDLFYCDRGDWQYVYKNNYSYMVVFMTKTSLSGTGLLVEELSINKRKEIESNIGLEITAIRKDSDAYLKNIVPGDILTKIDGNIIKDKKTYDDIINASKGKIIKLSIIRKDKTIEKEIQLY